MGVREMETDPATNHLRRKAFDSCKLFVYTSIWLLGATGAPPLDSAGRLPDPCAHPDFGAWLRY